MSKNAKEFVACFLLPIAYCLLPSSTKFFPSIPVSLRIILKITLQ